MSDEKWTKMDIGPNMISFGTQRIPVRNVASISIKENEAAKKEINKSDNALSFVGLVCVSAFVANFFIFKIDNGLVLNNGVFPVLSSVFVISLSILVIIALHRIDLHLLYDLMLLTNGGSITALTGLKKDFAEKVLDALESAISGANLRPIHIDASQQNIQFGNVDMSQKNYKAENSPGAILGDNPNANVATNVSIQGLQDVDRLIGRVAQIAQGQDRAELLARLDEIRAHLKDGSVSKDQAKSAYADLFARIGKYASGAKDIIELVLTVGKFL